MADHNHQIGIDITADEGNYVAAAGRAEKETDKLTESMKRAERAATEASTKAEQLAKSQQAAGEAAAQAGTKFKPLNEAIEMLPAGAERVARVAAVLPAGLGVAAAAAVAMGVAYAQASVEVERSNQAIVMSGNAAGTSIAGISDAARVAADNIGSTQMALTAAMQQIVASGQLGADSMQMMGAAAVSLERTTGKAVGQTVKEFEELGRSPVQASLKLNEQYHYLTAAIFEQIKALEDQGRAQEAAALAQKTYGEEMLARGMELQDNLGIITRLLNGAKEAAKGFWDTMLDIGREETLQEKIDKLEQLTAPGRGPFAYRTPEEEAELKRLRAQKSREDQKAKDSAQVKADDQAHILWLQEGDKYLSKEEQKRKAILDLQAKYIANSKAIGNNQQEQVKAAAEYEKRLASINEKYATKNPKAREKSDPLADVRAEALGQEVGLSAGTVKALEKLDEQLQKGNISLSERDRLLNSILDKDPVLRKEQEDINKALEDYVKATEAAVGPLEREAAQLERKEELTRRSRSEIELSIVAQLEEARAVAEANGAKEQQLAVLDREIAARRRIAESSAAIDAAKVAEEASKKAQQEADRLSDTMSRSVADGLMRGFEKGEDFFDVFLNTLKNAAATAILQPIIKPIVDPIAQGMSEVGKGIGSWISNIFSSWHTGGVPGLDAPAYTHALPSGLFAGAPRYHSGAIAGDEVATVLQRGEGVFTEGQMKKLAPADQRPNVKIQFDNQGTAKEERAPQQMAFDGESWVIKVFLKDFSRNGPMRQALSGMQGS